jgi:hypothetical protein
MARRRRGHVGDRGVVNPFGRTRFDVPDLDVRSREELTSLKGALSEDGPEDTRDRLIDAGEL